MSLAYAYGPIVKAYEENSHWKYGTLLFPVSGEGWCILLVTGKFGSRLINLLCLQAIGDKEIDHFTVVCSVPSPSCF